MPVMNVGSAAQTAEELPQPPRCNGLRFAKIWGVCAGDGWSYFCCSILSIGSTVWTCCKAGFLLLVPLSNPNSFSWSW